MAGTAFVAAHACSHAGHGVPRQSSPTLARLARDGAGPNAGFGPGSSSACAAVGGRTNVNHLYSVAALTDASGQVVERYSYTAYGKQTVTSATGAVRAKSAVGWDRGFTGYVADQETGLLHARARQYSPTLGRFIGRDKERSMRRRSNAGDGYRDGFSLYSAYFSPNQLDPLGLAVTRAYARASRDPIGDGATINVYIVCLDAPPCTAGSAGPFKLSKGLSGDQAGRKISDPEFARIIAKYQEALEGHYSGRPCKCGPNDKKPKTPINQEDYDYSYRKFREHGSEPADIPSPQPPAWSPTDSDEDNGYPPDPSWPDGYGEEFMQGPSPYLVGGGLVGLAVAAGGGGLLLEYLIYDYIGDQLGTPDESIPYDDQEEQRESACVENKR